MIQIVIIVSGIILRLFLPHFITLLQLISSYVIRSEIIALRSERDKLALEAEFAREKLDSVMREAEHQVKQLNVVYVWICVYLGISGLFTKFPLYLHVTHGRKSKSMVFWQETWSFPNWLLTTSESCVKHQNL